MDRTDDVPDAIARKRFIGIYLDVSLNLFFAKVRVLAASEAMQVVKVRDRLTIAPVMVGAGPWWRASSRTATQGQLQCG